jgi:hypothetical protein
MEISRPTRLRHQTTTPAEAELLHDLRATGKWDLFPELTREVLARGQWSLP